MSLFKRGSGLVSPHQAASELDVLLQLKTKPKHRNSTTSTKDKTQTQKFHDKLKAESWRAVKLWDRPKRTWDEAAYKSEHKASHKQDMKQIAWIQQFFRGRLLSELTREVIAEVGEVKRKKTSPSTANRYLATIRAILRRAALDWEWIEKAPFIRLYKEPKRRIRWIEPEQVRMLLDELPEHLVDLVKFSLCTGLRKRNVTELEWSQVDMQRNVAWIHPDQAKARKSIHISLNATAMDVLSKQIGKHPVRVFTYRGNQLFKSILKHGIEH